MDKMVAIFVMMMMVMITMMLMTMMMMMRMTMIMLAMMMDDDDDGDDDYDDDGDDDDDDDDDTKDYGDVGGDSWSQGRRHLCEATREASRLEDTGNQRPNIQHPSSAKHPHIYLLHQNKMTPAELWIELFSFLSVGLKSAELVVSFYTVFLTLHSIHCRMDTLCYML